MISYAIFSRSGKFQRLLTDSSNSINFYWHGKENSSEFWVFLQGSRTFYDNVFLGSR